MGNMSIGLLKNKDFTLLIFGKLVSLLGSNIQQFALSLYVLALTGSATIFASILSISILPRLLFSPIAGVFGDWFNKKYSIVILDTMNAIILGSFALIVWMTSGLSLPMIYVLVILLEITEIFFHASMSAVIPSIVKKEEYLEANSFNSLVMNIGNLLSPVIAALIYGTFGMLVILMVNAISFLLSAMSELLIHIPQKKTKPEKISFSAFKKDFVEGIALIKNNRFISSLISLATIINFCIGPLFSVGLIFIMKEVLETSDFQFGLFQMVLSASFLIAPILLSSRIKQMKIGKLCFISFVSIAGIILLLALTPSGLLLNNFIPRLVPYILITLLSFIVGGFVAIANISIGTLFNQIVPLELMGRTSSVINLSVTIFIPLGQMLFGYLYDIIAPSYVIGSAGVILLLSVLKFRKALMNADALEENKEQLDEIQEEHIIEGELVDAI
jgi:MFS family permease